MQGPEAGEETFGEQHGYVAARHVAAAEAVWERRGAPLALHRLGVPSTPYKVFLSTNIIEKTIRNWRAATGDVKRW
ncbi:MAG: hypothetical protein R3F11_18245 [Verrucomicrobiales bacterium]